jgi:phage gpG-like protein
VIIIKTFGMDHLLLSLRGKAFRMRNTRPVMEAIAEDMLRVEAAQFDSQGRRGGGSWKRDLPSTVERKLFGDRDPRIMHDRERLRISLTKRDSPDNVLEVTDNTIRFGTRVPYAATHQYGRGHIPARPIIKFLPRDRERWARMVGEHVMGA